MGKNLTKNFEPLNESFHSTKPKTFVRLSFGNQLDGKKAATNEWRAITSRVYRSDGCLTAHDFRDAITKIIRKLTVITCITGLNEPATLAAQRLAPYEGADDRLIVYVSRLFDRRSLLHVSLGGRWQKKVWGLLRLSFVMSVAVRVY